MSVWTVGRANELVGSRTGRTQKLLRQTLGVKAWPGHLTLAAAEKAYADAVLKGEAGDPATGSGRPDAGR